MIDTGKIKELMKEKGIKNIRELSEKTLVHKNTIYYMFKEHDARISTLMMIADYFNVPVDSLLKRNNEVVVVNNSGISVKPFFDINYLNMVDKFVFEFNIN